MYCLESSENNTYPSLPDQWYTDCSDVCFNDPENDFDQDGICGDIDECPYDQNNDADNDGICDDIDDCVGDYDECGICNGDGVDADEDGICDDIDDCVGEYDDCDVCNGPGIDTEFISETTWVEDYETVPFDNEFSATIAIAQIFIDGVEQTTGQLAAFGEDGIISALDANGTSYFPPSDINIYELSVWSNSASGEIITFKYFDSENNIIIDLNESYTFVSNDIVGDGFNPYILTGEFTPCDCDGNVFDDCGVCGGDGLDADLDGICDDVDDCVGEYDDCGVCNGENADLDDCGVCFGNNEDLDCNGDCFGTALI